MTRDIWATKCCTRLSSCAAILQRLELPLLVLPFLFYPCRLIASDYDMISSNIEFSNVCLWLCASALGWSHKLRSSASHCSDILNRNLSLCIRSAIFLLCCTQTVQAQSVSFAQVGSLSTARSGHTAVLLGNGQALVTGGWTGSTVFSSSELYDPGTGTHTECVCVCVSFHHD